MKQVILVREDLLMPIGKACVQCAHASVEAVLKSPADLVKAWKKEGMTKVVLVVKDQKHLMVKLQAAKNAGLVTALIRDAGKTFFTEPTVTCLGVGPAEDDKIDAFSGNLTTL
jgi:peptidyl-tRNA hydrolase, PTH2 family